MAICTEYIPYTLTEIESNITRVYGLIVENSGLGEGEIVRNGQDEYEVGKYMQALYRELEMWKNLRCKKKIELGEATGNKFFISGQYGT